MLTTKTLSKLNLPWRTIFLFTIPAIWLDRNTRLFQNIYKPPQLVAKTALYKAAEFLSNENSHPSPPNPPPLLTPTHPWKLPNRGWFQNSLVLAIQIVGLMDWS